MLTSVLRTLIKNYWNVIVLMTNHKNLCNKTACISLLRKKQMFYNKPKIPFHFQCSPFNVLSTCGSTQLKKSLHTWDKYRSKLKKYLLIFPSISPFFSFTFSLQSTISHFRLPLFYSLFFFFLNHHSSFYSLLKMYYRKILTHTEAN